MDHGETTVKACCDVYLYIEEEGGHQGLRSWTNQDYEDASGYMNRANNGASLLHLLITVPTTLYSKIEHIKIIALYVFVMPQIYPEFDAQINIVPMQSVCQMLQLHLLCTLLITDGRYDDVTSKHWMFPLFTQRNF